MLPIRDINNTALDLYFPFFLCTLPEITPNALGKLQSIINHTILIAFLYNLILTERNPDSLKRTQLCHFLHQFLHTTYSI